MTVNRATPILVHLAGAAAASALLAFWALRLLAPAAQVSPLAAAPVPSRDPDVRLAARLFGDISGQATGARNIEVTGVFAAGKVSSAVIAIDGKSARAVLLGQEVFPGARLVAVAPDGVTIEQDGARSQYPAPVLAAAKSTAPAPMFRREGDTLTAPSRDPATANRANAAPGPGQIPLPRDGGARPPAPNARIRDH